MTIEHSIEQLKNFIAKALKLGKYTPPTSAGYTAAIKLVEKGLLPDEPSSIEYIENHVMEIFARQNDLPLSPQSLKVYVSRVRTVISDYKTYGIDSTKIYTWNRNAKSKSTPKRNDSKESLVKESAIRTSMPYDDEMLPQKSVNSEEGILYSHRWKLRPNLMITIQLPDDLNNTDVEKLQDYLALELKYSHKKDKASE